MIPVYLIGSLRNPAVRVLGSQIRGLGFDVFDDWHAAGHDADEQWQKYEKERGRSYEEAIEGHAARHTFAYDKKHLDRAEIGVLVMPAGKSGHLEIGYLAGRGKSTYVLFDAEPERWDVMYQFCTRVCFSVDDLFYRLCRHLDMGRVL